MRVFVRNNNVEAALARFRRLHADKMKEVNTRQEYEKPTSKRNRERRIAIKREMKRQHAGKITKA